MRISVPMIGKGVNGDAFRADLPTYTIVDADYVNGIMLVDVPDADFPDMEVSDAQVAAHGADAKPTVVAFKTSELGMWRTHLRERYGLPESYSPPEPQPWKVTAYLSPPSGLDTSSRPSNPDSSLFLP